MDELPLFARRAFEFLQGTTHDLGADLSPGELMLDESRALLASPLGSGAQFYAVPTAKGWTCTAMFIDRVHIASGCDKDLSGGLTINFRDRSDGKSLFVFGLLEDGIAQVDVIIDGKELPAVVGRNAFFLATSWATSAEHVEEVRLHRSSGEVSVVDLG